MAAGDPQGWESLGLNDPTKYKASINLKDSTQSQNIKMRVVTDRVTGNYDVYKADILGDTLVYQYNASNNKTTPVDKKLYKEFFTGPNARQNTNFNRTVKQRTLELAKNNLSGQTSRNEYQTLQGRTGYRSLSNTQQQNPVPPTTTPPGPGGGGDGGGESLNGDESGDALDYGGNNFQVDTNTKTVGGKSELLRYPLESPPPGLNYDYIKIRAYEYAVTGVGLKKENISDASGPAYETIILPMQPNIEDTNNVNWSADTLSPIQAALGEFANKAIGALGSVDGQAMLNAFKGLGGDLKTALDNNERVKNFITSYFAGQAVGANLVGRSTGMVINPNLELLFNGPTLRTFNFSFPMSPRNKKEAEQIRKIIRAFKRNSAVQRSNDGLFLKSPRVFKIEYIYNGGVTENENGEQVATGGQHPYLNKIRLCALTSFKVNYTPDNTYMTFHENGSLTSYNISMSFNELNPIYADQYPDNEENMGF